ncbi:hypothetical protein DENIS_2922 [Desulfonema ishimotonii]|uniref:Transposase IS4-like domain-containing protein n=1 Tax=Desulfonema ishimotonii TaxID=45657 RepID=A0A401FYC8_9BACT|nr:hypothetical protein [Desulfonema ishimotonii]GBC61960.1 hypothetical protein DENIS_2922 [Desulfonema ishimotonii]
MKKREYRHKGGKRVREALADGEKKPVAVCDFAKNLNDHFWYGRTVSEGTKGPVVYEFTRRRVTLSRDGLPWKEVCPDVRRSPGKKTGYTFYISNAPLSTRLGTFVWLNGIRWAAEQCFGEIKSELGGDHYEVRKYNGWHRHMLTCVLAHFFLWRIKIKLEKKSALTHFATARNASRNRTADENILCNGNH